MPTLSAILHHLQTFWNRREDRNIELFHYSDLHADLLGQQDARLEEFAASGRLGA
jgi:hypothetical protein